MDNFPLVSISLITYNRENFLRETIKSILNQSYKNFELVIFDNYSNYDFLSLISSFNDSRIRPFQNINNGIYVINRNLSIKKAIGKYIIICDDDDIWESKKLEKQVLYLNKNSHISVVGTSFFCIDKSNNIIDQIKWPQDLGQMMYATLTGYSPIGQPGTIIRKSVFDKIGLYEPQFSPVEDYRFWLKIISYGYKIHNINEKLLRYRIHKDQTSKRRKKTLLKKQVVVFDEFYRNLVNSKKSLDHIKVYLKVFSQELKIDNNNLETILSIFSDLLTKLDKNNNFKENQKIYLNKLLLNFIANNRGEINIYKIFIKIFKKNLLKLHFKSELKKIYKSKIVHLPLNK